MRLVAIEEQNLIDIGDALRRRHGETRVEIVIEEVEVPTLQIIKSSENSTIDNCGDSKVGKKLYVVDFTGAKAIKVYSTVNAATGGLNIYKGRHTEETIATAERLGGYSKGTKITNTYNTDVITLQCETVTSSQGYYIECSGLDENGETISGIVEVEKEVEVPNAYFSSEMAQAIDDIPKSVPEEAFVMSGNCMYKFAHGGWDWFLKIYEDRIITKNITTGAYMFDGSLVTEIPFDINCDNSMYANYSYMFSGCRKLKKIQKIVNMYPDNISNIFADCEFMREIPEFVNLNLSRLTTWSSASMTGMFSGCRSLRSVPEEFLKQFYNVNHTGYYYSFLYNTFNGCFALDEIKGLNPQTGTITSNMFSSAYNNCHRLKNYIFATQDDGVPYSVNWKNQIIDLTQYVGYCQNNLASLDSITKYNSGITPDKKVSDEETYNNLKNDNDWYAANLNYSRYNKQSALNTINSLPDTSAYLASAGGTNTIKFKGASGSATDSGAINTLTAEEIALASAKGWTVSFA